MEQHGADVRLLHEGEDLGEAAHGFQGHQALRIIFVIHAVDHAGQKLGSVLLHLQAGTVQEPSVSRVQHWNPRLSPRGSGTGASARGGHSLTHAHFLLHGVCGPGSGMARRDGIGGLLKEHYFPRPFQGGCS